MQPCAHPAEQSREIAKRGWHHHSGLAGLRLLHHALRRLSVGLAAAVLGSVLALGNIAARPACAEETSTESAVAKAASAEPDVPAAVAVTDDSNPGVPVAAAEVTQGEGSTAKAPVVGAAEGTTTSNVEASNSQPSKTEVPTVSPAPADTVASSARATRDGTPVASDTQTDEKTASAKALASPSVPASSSSSTSPMTDAGTAVSKNVSVAPTHAPSTETSAPAFGTPTSPGTPVRRLFNHYVTTGTHFLTTSVEEEHSCVRVGWKSEGTAWYTARHAPLDILGF